MNKSLITRISLILFLNTVYNCVWANNGEPIKGLRSNIKLVKPTVKFNTFGKQLAYKRKLAFEGKDSAEAYVKVNQLLDDYLPLTGGVLTGALTTPSLSVTNGYINGMAIGTNGTSVEITSGNLNSITASGFYRGQGIGNAPDGGWWYIVVEGHDNTSPGWTKQTATAYGADNTVVAGSTYIRNQTNGTWTAWRAVAMQDWALGAFINTQGNVEQNINGIKHFHSDKGNGVYLGSSSNPSLQAFSTDGGAAFMTFHRENQFAVNVGLDPDNVFRIGGWSAPANTLQLDMSGNLTVAGNINAAYKIGAANTYTNGSFNATIDAGSGGQRSRVLSLLDRGYIDAVLENGGQASFVFGSGYSGVDAMYINTHNGNIGIRTTSPSSYGHGGTNSVLEIHNPNTAVNSQSHLLLTSNTTAAGSAIGSVTWLANQAPFSSAGWISGITENDNEHVSIHIGTSATQRFTVKSDGNVGIGTTDPKSKLEVAGNAKVSYFSQNTTAYPSFSIENASGYPQTASITSLQFKGGEEASAMGELKVSGTDYGSGNSSLSVNLLKSHNPFTAMYIDGSTSNIGIGTISPNKKFEINNVNDVTDGIRIGYGGSAQEGFDIQYLNTGNSTAYLDSRWDNEAALMKFRMRTNGTPVEAMSILGNGNVCIGISPIVNNSYKLNVAGNIRSNKIVVNTTGADFVFDSTYHLPSLETVADFIKANKHLPQIASAEEMQKNGLDVGEQQTKLLQKIEELTLYLIEMDKKLNNQNILIQQQQNEIKILKKKGQKCKVEKTNE